MSTDSSPQNDRPDSPLSFIRNIGQKIFPAILDTLEEPFFLLDEAFRLVWHNKACNDIYRSVSGKDIDTGFDFNELLTKEQQSLFIEQLTRVIEGERAHFEWKYQISVTKWLSVSLYPFRSCDDTFSGVCGSLRDITEKKLNELERKQAEEQMKASEIKYRMLVNSLSEGVILQTLDREILTVNKSASAILGIDKDELKEKGFPFPGCILVDENEKILSHEGLFFKKNGQIHAIRNKIIGLRKTDGIQWLKLNSAVVANVQQKAPYTIAISFEDITEQKRISGEMEVLALLARETVNAVIILRPDGEMLWMNEGFSRLTGYTTEDFLGKKSRAFLSGPESDMNTVGRAAFCRQNGLPFTEEFLIYTKAGEKVWTRVQGQSIRWSAGSVTHYFLIITDITEEKKILAERLRMEEERLQNEIEQQKKITHVILQTQELERNQLGRELHDNINQILAAIRMQLAYCLENFSNCEPVLRQCRENIQEAMEETRRLSHKMVMPRFSERSLPQALKALIQNYQFAQTIQLDTSDWNDQQTAVGIKEAFYRMVQEQLSNIYKHARATRVTIQIKSDAKRAMLSVEDNGVGFNPSKKKSGIGISNIRSRAEFCDGTSKFISAPGKGCRLLVKIPLA